MNRGNKLIIHGNFGHEPGWYEEMFLESIAEPKKDRWIPLGRDDPLPDPSYTQWTRDNEQT